MNNQQTQAFERLRPITTTRRDDVSAPVSVHSRSAESGVRSSVACRPGPLSDLRSQKCLTPLTPGGARGFQAPDSQRPARCLNADVQITPQLGIYMPVTEDAFRHER